MFLVHWFVLLIYQPFFNLLVFIYWLLEFFTGGHAEMGIAVILLTIIIRILILPLSLMEEKTAASRRELEDELHRLERDLSADPIQYKKAVREIFQRNRYVVRAGMVSLAVQVAIALMLWRMFATGLSGEDMHLLYPFMPAVEQPFKLTLGSFDLTRSSLLLNIFQSVMILVVETVGLVTSPFPPRPGEAVRLQLVLPIVSFILFLGLPAGKKVFVITALFFTLGVQIFKFIRRKFREYTEVKTTEDLIGESPSAPPILVETK